MKSLILDLDLTLVDSTIAEKYRCPGKWDQAYTLIPKFILYDGFESVFDFIRKNGVKVCIVTSSPRPYTSRVVKHFNIPCDNIVAFHDTKFHKPHAQPMLNALELMMESAENVISFGDRAADMQSSNAANIASVACFWGTEEKDKLMASSCNHAINHPSEILTLIQ